jgi:hypothetical protein
MYSVSMLTYVGDYREKFYPKDQAEKIDIAVGILLLIAVL